MTRKAGIGHWHAHEGLRTAVSIMSSNGVPIQDIGDTAGHKSTQVTETFYRRAIHPHNPGGARSRTTASVTRITRREIKTRPELITIYSHELSKMRYEFRIRTTDLLHAIQTG